jgi:hypothetical protein
MSGDFLRDATGSETAGSDGGAGAEDSARSDDVLMAIQPLSKGIHTPKRFDRVRATRDKYSSSFTGNDPESQALMPFSSSQDYCRMPQA